MFSSYVMHTTPDVIEAYTDENGTVAWNYAKTFARMHSLEREFVAEYGIMEGQRVDSGELLNWMGY